MSTRGARAVGAGTAPSRRPSAAERRPQLAEAAAARFHQVGYHRVSVADVATDVGITAPAVYRYFRNKQDLLAGAIESGLRVVEDALERTLGRSLETLVEAVAELVIDRPDLWTLLQREVRFLDADRRAAVCQQVGRVIAAFVTRLRALRPDLSTDDALLLVMAATATLATPSVPRSMPRLQVSRDLGRAAMAVLQLPWPARGPQASLHKPASSPGAEASESRRTELLDSAIDLFCRQGYSAVSLDDIGASIGIAGPSIYHHFATKADILVAAFSRATDRLTEVHEQGRDNSEQTSLVDLVGIYTDFCLSNRSLVGVYVSETTSLPSDARRRIRKVLRVRIAHWTAALLEEEPTLDERVARLRSLAALTVIDDLVRLGQFHSRPTISTDIRAVAMAILRSPAGRRSRHLPRDPSRGAARPG